MKLDFTDLPIGENGLSNTLVDQIWESISPSLERTGLEEFRRKQREIVGRTAHDAGGSILTAYGNEVAAVLPIRFTKVAFALVHLAENARVNSAMDESDGDEDQSTVRIQDLIAEDEASDSGAAVA